MSLGPESFGDKPDTDRIFNDIVRDLGDSPDIEPKYVSAFGDVVLIRALYASYRNNLYSQQGAYDIHDLVRQATELKERTMITFEQLGNGLKIGDYVKASGQTVFYIEKTDGTLTRLQLQPGFAIGGNLVAISPEAMPSDDDLLYFTEQPMGIDPALERLLPRDPHFPTIRLRDANTLDGTDVYPIKGDVLVPLYETLKLQRLQ